MKKLNFYSAVNVDELAWPEEVQALSLESPALEFFTDFNTTVPFVIASTVSAIDVKNIMLKTHVRLKFVINDRRQLLGIVSTDDLIDRRIMQKISKGIKREEIMVTDLMRPKQDLVTLDYGEVFGATIGDVIQVLKDSGQQHCLVVDRGSNKVRGIFSASDISRMLHLPINIQEKSSFYKVYSATA